MLVKRRKMLVKRRERRRLHARGEGWTREEKAGRERAMILAPSSLASLAP
jgi:hypothetical protein